SGHSLALVFPTRSIVVFPLASCCSSFLKEKEKALQINQCHYYGKRMARKPNPVKSVQITVSTTALVHGYLSALVETGLYGKNPAEAAERLIAKGVEVALAGGIIPRRERTRNARQFTIPEERRLV